MFVPNSLIQEDFNIQNISDLIANNCGKLPYKFGKTSKSINKGNNHNCIKKKKTKDKKTHIFAANYLANEKVDIPQNHKTNMFITTMYSLLPTWQIL